MTGLEIPGFVISTAGVITVVDKTFEIWRSVAQSRGFGKNLASVLARFSMEHHRFLTWARQADAQSTSDRVPAERPSDDGDVDILSPFSLHGSLKVQIQAQIETAVVQILEIMQTMESIVSKYRTKGVNSPVPQPTNRTVASGLRTVLPLIGTQPNLRQTQATAKRQQSEHLLQKMTSTRLRIVYGSRPWGESDKAELEGLVKIFRYWNNCLRELLPPRIAQSVAEQAPLGQTLVEENKDTLPDLIKAFADGNVTAWQHANLWHVREEFEAKWAVNGDEIRNLRLDFDNSTFLNPKSDPHCSLLELREWVSVKDGPQQVGIEWYPYHQKWNTDDLKLADKRIAELAYTCATERKPKTLHILHSLGFVQDISDHRASGLVFQLPQNAHPAFVPRSLASLLTSMSSNRKKPNFRLPSLEERLQLAFQLASSLHSLAVVRWLHQNLASRHVVFFMDISTSRLQLNSPYVIGFGISRPEGHEQVSLNKDVEKDALHLHPDLRVAASSKDRPRYVRLYDVYSLGILLYEVGAWTSISALASQALEPADFKEAVITRCRKELAFYVGVRYRDVVLRCLTGPTDDEDEDWTESVDSFYWRVVMELLKCQQ